MSAGYARLHATPPPSPSFGAEAPVSKASVSNSRLRRLLLATLGVVVLLAVLLHSSPDAAATSSSVAATLADKLSLSWTNSGPTSSSGSSSNDRITLIVMWDDDHMSSYLPSLFRSARYNADAVDLLFINVLRHGSTCLEVSSFVEDASNIRVECITDQEDKVLIRDYFCQGAWQCTPEQVAEVDKHLKERVDPIHVEFKPWRGGIYKQFIETEWWAWLDADQIIGDFRNLWPWQTVDNFDVVTISEWDYGNIYLRGQFTAFKQSEKLEQTWLDYEPLSAPEKLHLLPSGAVDEFEYSVLYSNLFTNLNWILIPRALGADKFGRNKVISHGRKAYYVPSGMTRNDMSLLFHPKHQPISEPIFAAHEPFDPELWSVPLRELRHGDWVNGKPLEDWCDQKETRCTVAREYYAYKSCVMRYNGQLLEYFDRRSAPRAVRDEAGYFGVEEKLLLHWQEIKRRDWFDMPKNGVQPNEVFEMSSDYIVSWDIHTHETRMLVYADGYKYAQAPEPLGFGYRSVNNSDQLQLPPGMLAEIASIPVAE